MAIKVDVPTGLELQISVPKLVRRCGHKAAGLVRKRLQAGLGARGQLPLGDGTPLRDTGALIRSIKFMPRGKLQGVIFATGTREDGKRNGMILAVQMARMLGLRSADPLGINAALQDAVAVEAQAEIRKQITAKDTKLVAKKRKKK